MLGRSHFTALCGIPLQLKKCLTLAWSPDGFSVAINVKSPVGMWSYSWSANGSPSIVNIAAKNASRSSLSSSNVKRDDRCSATADASIVAISRLRPAGQFERGICIGVFYENFATSETGAKAERPILESAAGARRGAHGDAPSFICRTIAS